MNFELDSEQEMLRDSVQRWVQKTYAFNDRQKVRNLPHGFSKEHWKEIADLGWLAVALPEDVGGIGQSTIESCLIAEELGRGLVLEPYVAVGVLGAHLVDRAGSADQRNQWLPDLISGERILTVAHSEHESAGGLGAVQTKAEKSGDGWKLSGSKSLVFAADAAQALLVSARTSGNFMDEDGISLFAVDPNAAGVKRRDYRTVDGTHASDITLDNVHVPATAVVGTPGKAFTALEYAYDRATITLCAEALGMMEQSVVMTCDYLKTRKQFGVPIGTFQVLQHRAADMYIETQVARAAVWRALAFLSAEDASQRRRAVASAKAQVGKTARSVCGQAVQLHGGIAITEEFPIGHYFKRMTLFDLTFGNTQAHLNSIAAAISRSAA